jgi:hypothetical protein
MRGRRISFLVLIILLVGAGATWLGVRQPRRQTISLPDGSQLTLLKVTHGTNHVCRYRKRLQDFFYPILPQRLRTKFPPREMKFTSSDADTVMVWLRHDGARTLSRPPLFFLTVADENGLESQLLHGANVTRTLNARNEPAFEATASATQISGWELKSFPRQAGRFMLRVYRQEGAGKVNPVGEFAVRNPPLRAFPIWTTDSPLRVRRTNGLEITLTKLETGLTGKEIGHGPAGEGAKSFSRATFTVKENGAPTEKWSVCGISVANAAGEIRPSGSYGSSWEHGEHKVDFDGALWLEAAWQLKVDFARTGDFPADELWFIKGVSVPRPGELAQARVVTNLHLVELEFLGVSGSEANLTEDYAGILAHSNIHMRTPHPMDGLRLVLVEVRDDQGGKLAAKGSTSRTSMGGRGNTPRDMLHGFGVEIPEDAKTLDITLAVTRVRSVEFLAKPVIYNSRSERDVQGPMSGK